MAMNAKKKNKAVGVVGEGRGRFGEEWAGKASLEGSV